jgi:hypothetical protein
MRHRNGHALGCRGENLVRCTAADRSRGQAAHRDKRTSKYKGVYFDKPSGNFHAHIMIGGKRKNLGRFATQRQAAEVYDRAAPERLRRLRTTDQLLRKANRLLAIC